MARGRRSGFAKKIDTVHWTVVQALATSLAAGSVAFTLLAAQHLPETLLRIRGEWMAAIKGPLPPDRGVLVTMGIIQVPEGTGTTVLWSPFTDGDAPWIWWDALNLIYTEYVVDTVASQNTPDGRRVVDSKAMRKIRNTELQLVIENTTTLGGETVTAGLTGRVLAGS